MSKFLPVQDLSVEEVPDVPPVPAHMDYLERHMKPKRVPQVKRKEGSGYVLNPHAGVNAILLMFFARRPAACVCGRDTSN